MTIPKRSKSWWDMWVLIISIAQHAKPNERVHKEFLRASANNSSDFAVTAFGSARLKILSAGELPLLGWYPCPKFISTVIRPFAIRR